MLEIRTPVYTLMPCDSIIQAIDLQYGTVMVSYFYWLVIFSCVLSQVT